jgi:hypothetical protein
MNSTIIATVVIVGVCGCVALLIWWLKQRSKGQEITSDWTSEGDTSFVSKIAEPPAKKPEATTEELKNQPPS